MRAAPARGCLARACPTQVQQIYRPTSRELARLTALARSGLFGSFGQAIHSRVTTRAYRRGPTFERQFGRRLALYQKLKFCMNMAAVGNP